MSACKTASLVLLCLWCLPDTSHALAPGTLHIYSELDEPLKASIDLELDAQESWQRLAVRETTDTSAPAGYARKHPPLRFAIRQDNHTIEISTLQPFKARALDFDLNASLGALQVTRHYHAPMPGPHATPALLNGPIYGPTRASDTLWSVAELMRLETPYTQDQMLLGLIEANRDSLEAHTLNLKPGRYLHFPPESVLGSLEQKTTRQHAAQATMTALSGTKTPPLVAAPAAADDSRHTDTTTEAPNLQPPPPPLSESTPATPVDIMEETAQDHEDTHEVMIEQHDQQNTGIVTDREIQIPALTEAPHDQTTISLDSSLLAIGLLAIFGAFCAGLVTGSLSTYLITRPGRKKSSPILDDAGIHEASLPQAGMAAPLLANPDNAIGQALRPHDSIDDMIGTLRDLKAQDRLVLKPDPSASGSIKAKPRPGSDGVLQDLTDNDPLETRLDLAKSYLGMGDLRQAKKLLGNVLNMGNELQIREAMQLMKRADSQQEVADS
ncbi:MAG: hypothetical protein RIQ52_2037 [Pseudomonadota bacterium]